MDLKKGQLLNKFVKNFEANRLKKAKFVIFGLEKAKLATLKSANKPFASNSSDAHTVTSSFCTERCYAQCS